MAELVPGSPWSEVVRVEDRGGDRGGAYWLLTLACDHVAVRPRPQLKMASARIPFAPRRVRCYTCGHRATSASDPAARLTAADHEVA